MKRRNHVPCDEARWINANSIRKMDLLDTETLQRHLESIYLFKLGLQNSFAIHFRDASYTPAGSDRPVLFNYLSEVIPLLASRANQLPRGQRDAYEKLAGDAVESFWEIYTRFQPVIQRASQQSGVSVDDLGNVLGRTILLYEKTKGFKFCSYLAKTIRESIKNLRGQVYAERYHLPVSAGRLLPKLFWLLDQESLRLERKLSEEENDQFVRDCIAAQPAKFSVATIRRIAMVARNRLPDVGYDVTDPMAIEGDREASSVIDHDEEIRIRIWRATERAEFTDRERAILLNRLDLAFDAELYEAARSELTDGSLRNRKSQLLIRFLAAFHSEEAKSFGRFLHADPMACKPILIRALGDLADRLGVSLQHVCQCVANEMTLTNQPYRVTIAQRGQLDAYLAEHPMCKKTKLGGLLFHKLKAALIDQDRQGFPCILDHLTD